MNLAGKTQVLVASAKTPAEVLSIAMNAFHQMLHDPAESGGVKLVGKNVVLEFNEKNTHQRNMEVGILTFTGTHWKQPKSREDFKDQLQNLLQAGDDVEQIVTDGFRLLVDFFGMSLRELHVYEDEKEAAEAREKWEAERAAQREL
ncbi:hypothetical protein M3Y99_00658000 [Aphelenchoides fujianensis]|nr:hypothetical protein M3Y99_00658000 [Aphelenchoides fujianensis]